MQRGLLRTAHGYLLLYVIHEEINYHRSNAGQWVNPYIKGQFHHRSGKTAPLKKSPFQWPCPVRGMPAIENALIIEYYDSQKEPYNKGMDDGY
jgi:hypothetical protein